MEKKYYYGNAVSEYGVQNGKVDYRCLASAFNHVLSNDIIIHTYGIGNWDVISGIHDYDEEIEELESQIEELEEELEELEEEREKLAEELEELDELEDKIESLKVKIDKLEDDKDDLEMANGEMNDIYQYYIVDEWGAELLQRADEIVFYNEELDMYLWGVDHYGTSWDYVLTGISLDD